MSTTTIRLPDELKARIAEAAEGAGTSPHNFIIEAIAEKAEHAERRRGFEDEAEQRNAAIVSSGRSVSWADMRSCLVDRAAGVGVRRSRARKLVR